MNTDRQIHELIQGSPEWDAFRLTHFGASEAAVMLGVSKNATRDELLRAKKTGIAKEFSDWLQAHVLDKGHEVEALARPLVEDIIGDELYPATYSMGTLSASCDGVTMDGLIAFEHKQHAAELFAMVEAGVLPPEHAPQCQQVLLVSGAERLIFVVSDGTSERLAYVWVSPDPAMQSQIVGGWAQFEKDLATYEPQEKTVAPTAAPVEALPAIVAHVEGKIAVRDNLAAFGEKLRAYIESIPKKPATDQEFADAEAAIKALEKAEDALKQAKAGALEQVDAVAVLSRNADTLHELARTTRLALEKLVKAEKENRRTAIVMKAQKDFADHIASLNASLGKPYMPAIAADFGAAIKGLKTIASIQNAVDTTMANAKVAAGEAFAKIQRNLGALREHGANHAFLFADTAQLVLKDHDDLVTLVKARITEHEAAEQKRIEAERERIRAEEQAKAEREARERVDAEQRAQQQSNTPATAEARGPAVVSAPAEAIQLVQPLQPLQPATDTGARITLGQINAAIAPISVSKDGLAQLGIEPVGRDRAAVLYRESDFGRICSALISRINCAQLRVAA